MKDGRRWVCTNESGTRANRGPDSSEGEREMRELFAIVASNHRAVIAHYVALTVVMALSHDLIRSGRRVVASSKGSEERS